MPIVRGQWAMLLAPGLNLRTFDRYRERPEEYSRYMNVRTSSRAYEEDQAITGFGPLAQKAELETTILDEPVTVGGVRYIHKTYALGFANSKEMRDDDQYGIMAELAGQLGRSARYTNELYGHDVLNNGFNTAKYVGRDALSLFNTAHPVRGTGGTTANRASVDAALSQSSLEAAVQIFQKQVDERGMPIDIEPSILLVSPDNELLARRLMMSAGYPGGNMNDINPIQGRLTIMISHYLSSSTAWYVLGPPADTDLTFYWREMMDTKTWDDDDADATFHKIRERFSTGFSDFRGTFGSPGM